MNKQEVIEKIERRKKYFSTEKIKRRSDYFSSEKDYDRGYRAGLDSTLLILKQLDEPEKPVISQFVADWYEGHKNDFEYNLYRLCINFHEQKLHEDLYEWFRYDENKPIETLILMHKFGYEVEKEKLYRMKHNLTGEYLCFTFGKTFHSDDLKWYIAIKRTQKEWEDMGYWNNNLYEPEEVEDD